MVIAYVLLAVVVGLAVGLLPRFIRFARIRWREYWRTEQCMGYTMRYEGDTKRFSDCSTHLRPRRAHHIIEYADDSTLTDGDEKIEFRAAR